MPREDVWKHPQTDSLKKDGKTLLTRIGGMPVLTEFIYGFYDNMLADPTLGAMLKTWMQTAPHEMYMKHLKDRTVDYLEIVWDCDTWEGQDMFIAHAHLHISGPFYDKAMKCAQSKLNKMSLSSALKKEMMAEMEVMREPITDPEGKFHAWIIARQKELEKQTEEGAIMGPMGFSMSAATHKNMKDKEQKAEERKQRLAAAKAERLAKEKSDSDPATKSQGKSEIEKPRRGTDKTENKENKEKLVASGKTKEKKPKSQTKTSKKAESATEVCPQIPDLPPDECDFPPMAIPESHATIGYLLMAI
jgi:truncated hemoglobin YjbI